MIIEVILFEVAKTALEGVVGNSAHSLYEKAKNQIRNNLNIENRLINHDLQKAFLRSYYFALKSIGKECLQQEKEDRNAKLWLKCKLDEIHKEIKSIGRKKQESQLIKEIDQIKLLLTTNQNAKNDIEMEKEKLVSYALRNDCPSSCYIKFIQDYLYERVCGFFAYEIKHNQAINNIFNSQVLSNIDTKTDQISDIGITTNQINAKLSLLFEYISKYQSAFNDEDTILIDNRKGFLSTGNFLGREELLDNIDNRLHQQNIVFLNSIGGVGKSELAKKYISEFGYQYDTIQYVTYVDQKNLAELLYEFNFAAINSYIWQSDVMSTNTGDHSQKDVGFEYRLNLLRKLDKNTLIIIDNFDIRPVKHKNDVDISWTMELRKFFGAINNAKVIFTTRSIIDTYIDYYIEIPVLEESLAFELFCKYYEPKNENEKGVIYKILKTIEYNTLLIKLISSLLTKSFIEPAAIYNNLLDGTDNVENEGEMNTVFGHIKSVFSISNLIEDEKKVLTYMVLAPLGGIYCNKFKDWSGLNNLNTVNSLVSLNWINKNTQGYLSLHPLINRILTEIFKPNSESCKEYITNMINEEHFDDETYDCIKFASGKITDISMVNANLYFYAGIVSVYEEQYEEAKELFQNAIQCNNALTNEGYVLYYLGKTHFYLGDNKKSIDYFIKANKSRRIQNNFDMLAQSYGYLINMYYDKLDVKTASKYAQKLLEIIKTKEIDTYNICICLVTVINLNIYQHDFDAAIANFERILTTTTDFSYELSIIMSKIYYMTDNKKKAIKMLDYAIENFCKAEADEKLREQMLLIVTFMRSIMTDTADVSFDTAVQIIDTMKRIDYLKPLSHMLQISVFSMIGDMHYRKQEYSESLKYYSETLGVIQQTNQDDSDVKAHIYLQMANLHANSRNPKEQEAIYFYKQAIRIYKKLKIEESLIKAYIGIADVYQSKEAYGKSLKYYNMALKKIEGKQHYAELFFREVCSKIAEVYTAKGNDKKASKYREDSRISSRDYIFRNALDNYLYTAEKNAKNEKYTNAIDFYDRAFDMCDEKLKENKNVAFVYASMGYICKKEAEIYKLIKPERAKEYFIKAIDYYNQNINALENSIESKLIVDINKDIAMSKVKKADILTDIDDNNNAISEYSEAIELYTKVLYSSQGDIFDINKDSLHRSMYNVYLKRGNAYEAEGLFQESLDNYNKVLVQLEYLKEAARPDESGTHNVARRMICDEMVEVYYKICDIQLYFSSYHEALKTLATILNLIQNEFEQYKDFKRKLAIKCEKIESSLEEISEHNEDLLKCFEEILFIKREALGRYNIRLSNTYMNIANQYKLEGDYEKAEEYCHYALSLEEGDYETNRLSIIRIYNYLGRLSKEKKKYIEALGWFRKSLPMMKEEFGEHHKTTTSIRHMIFEIEQGMEQ